MFALFLFLVLLTYCPAAVRARRTGDLWRLGLVCVLALFAIAGLALAAARLYSVPSAGRLVLYSLVMLGPAMLFTAGSLAVSPISTPTPRLLVTAYASGVLGLIVGFMIVMYGLWAD